MGLDMYLNRRSYVKNWDHFKPSDKHKIQVKKGGKIREDIKPDRISYIIEQVGYWRKFNALHKWFVDNVQNGEDDCKEYYVPQSKLQELKTTLIEVKRGKGKLVNNVPVAQAMLPTADGFFFGGVDYDDYYYEMIDRTLELLDEVIADSSGEYYYSASW